MYSGKFDVVNEGGTFFLNPDLDAEHLKAFGAVTNGVKQYYAAPARPVAGTRALRGLLRALARLGALEASAGVVDVVHVGAGPFP